MGPFRMLDLVGLDLGWRARKLSGTESPITAKINDALCDLDGNVILGGIMEHIEPAGIHSGDSACCLPSISISRLTTLDKLSLLSGGSKTIAKVSLQVLNLSQLRSLTA